MDAELKNRALSRLPKKKLESGKVYIQSTYNNTMMTLANQKGDTIIWSSAGALGFKGTRKGTPYASSKVAELLLEKAKIIGLENVELIIKGIGAGRESAIRSFVSSGININSIRDVTPVPHNGPRPPKIRRV
ncbi:MAG: 30S ribosomal protein S11 [Patescibacteria group bacterium]